MNQNLIIFALFALTAGLAALTGFCVYSYRALRRQFDQLVFDGEQVATLSENLIQAAQQFDRLHASLREQSERRETPQLEARAATASAGTNNRAQVLRLHGSGESNASIASALGISQGEVKLMVKVQELLAEKGA
jgi:DNA-binding NarL/FixJ family response regulator